MVIAFGIAIAAGVAVRLWFLFHEAIGADEATVGLMAQAALHGHFSAFFWGQDYGGAEAYVVALGFLLFGVSAWVLKATSIALFIVAVVLTYGIARQLAMRRASALAAAGLVWVWPISDVWNSTRELGFRDLTLCCGLSCLLIALKLTRDADDHPVNHSTGRRVAAVGAMGLLAGIGWWSSVEIAYFLLPALVLIAVSLVERRRRPTESGPMWSFTELAVGFGSTVLGALPWLWASVNDHFETLNLATNSGGPTSDYTGRLLIFFKQTLPLMLGLRLPVMVGVRRDDNPSWIVSPGAAHVLYGLALVLLAGAVFFTWRRGMPGRIVAVALVAFPLLYAVSASTSGGTDGRFGVYLVPFVSLALVMAVEQIVTLLHRRPRAALSAAWLAMLLVVITGITLAGFAEIGAGAVSDVPGFFSGWGNPDAPITNAIDVLRAHGVRVVLADYWEAGDVSFLGGGEPTAGAFDLVRNASRNREAFRENMSKGAAWLFYPPSATVRATTVFGSATPGPAGYSELEFESILQKLGVRYRVLSLGVLDAVIPGRPVDPSEVGIPAWMYTLGTGQTWTEWSTSGQLSEGGPRG